MPNTKSQHSEDSKLSNSLMKTLNMKTLKKKNTIQTDKIKPLTQPLQCNSKP